MHTTTLVSDGQTTWAGDTVDIVRAARVAGYTAEEHQGHYALAEPRRPYYHDGPDAYGDLCSRVAPHGNLPAEGEAVETLDYMPATYEHGFVCSQGLYLAMLSAEVR